MIDILDFKTCDNFIVLTVVGVDSDDSQFKDDISLCKDVSYPTLEL